jgi:hypothetical protein
MPPRCTHRRLHDARRGAEFHEFGGDMDARHAVRMPDATAPPLTLVISQGVSAVPDCTAS